MSAGGERTREGRLLGGRYRLTERIGSGGMGTVWQAYDELVERDVAVKQPRLPGDPEDEHHRRAAHRLYREARAAARVDHPAAVSIHDVVVEEDGLPWIVMELIRGESLHEVLQRGPVEACEAARIGLAVLGALDAAHAVGIVHRDVKPANVLLGAHGRVVLTDFGIAHVQGEESLTVSGEFVGSLEFVAPERMSGRGAGPASDLWSLGVLLYAAVEGVSPFRRTTVESTLAAVIASDAPEPKQAGPLGPLIARLLVKDPELRPGAKETGAVLEAVAEGWPVPQAETGAAAAQDTTGLREFADDVGTVRLGATPVPDTPAPVPEAASAAVPESDTAPTSGPRPAPEPSEPEPSEPEPSAEPATASVPRPEPAPKRALLRRRTSLAALAALLVGGTWLGAPYFVESDSKGVTEQTGTLTETPAREATPSPGATAWTVHRQQGMNAVLALPSRYRESAREGSAASPPRLVEYDGPDGKVTIRLTQWDRAPRSPMAQAQQAHTVWNSYNGDARTQYTRTTFHGYEAVQADTSYSPGDTPARVMQLMIRTDDGRMYELRVDMPKGTPAEKKGTALFKGARDRLVIGKS
ncbi:serine/threonine-protein kinase [Streptomyces sp. TLI_185]|uniref:serine/threonine-protein kinase n=1 Tax=Streptomyces sp. TLI_185 TaxID=2485151 RepID=UPI000F4FD429|nr:serine/threonine-protein kinase [Streptomyces sp. TLI_185]RPF35686.1 serine/threonine protein kinase [Streptomyces sp. TLI_185]